MGDGHVGGRKSIVKYSRKEDSPEGGIRVLGERKRGEREEWR
jgi:hypothetical protein